MNRGCTGLGVAIREGAEELGVEADMIYREGRDEGMVNNSNVSGREC